MTTEGEASVPSEGSLSLQAGDRQERLEVLPSDFYEPYLSELALMQAPNPIRKLIPLASAPDMLSLFAGIPAPEAIPFKTISVDVVTPDRSGPMTTLTVSGAEAVQALNYSSTEGLPQFIDWLYTLQEKTHGRKKGEGWKLEIGTGSQDLIYRACRTILDFGDTIILEAPVYAGVLPVFAMLKCEVIEIPTDANGIVAEALEQILKTWPAGKRLPKMLYTVPYGCNPTGSTASLDRRLHILRLAREYKFLILEDDPYYYLYYGDTPRPPSYFALEVTVPGPVGLVIRLDSLSKILSAGMRMAFVSAPQRILYPMNLLCQSANLQASGLSQALMYALLSHWGYEGFKKHSEFVGATYKRKRDLFTAAMKKHMSGLAEWDDPNAGMFLWFKLILPPIQDSSDGNSEDVIVNKAFEAKVLALPGTSFFANGRKSSYVRASFSVLPEDLFEESAKRLAIIVKKAWEEAGTPPPTPICSLEPDTFPL